MTQIPAGSSPLARGTPPYAGQVESRNGLIPARAGNTPAISSWVSLIWAHPRSRGEHLFSSGCTRILLGSSPLARGTRYAAGRGGARGGLIPARAGNTVTVTVTWSRSRAHPRSRGEHFEGRAGSCGTVGSSPLARGTQSLAEQGGVHDGLIPARAGNTPGADSAASWMRAHPRSRGEHGCCGSVAPTCWGSSPLARGTLPTPLGYPPPNGLIPARAGNTIHPLQNRG